MTEALLIDIVVIALLGATIYFAFRLDRRLQGMRSVQHELASVIRELNTAAARAEAGIQGLKMAAQVSGTQLEDKIQAARLAGDELAILLKTTERVGRTAEPLRQAEPVRYAEPARQIELPRYAEPIRRTEPSRPVEPARPPAPAQTRSQSVSRPALEALRALNLAG